MLEFQVNKILAIAFLKAFASSRSCFQQWCVILRSSCPSCLPPPPTLPLPHLSPLTLRTKLPEACALTWAFCLGQPCRLLTTLVLCPPVSLTSATLRPYCAVWLWPVDCIGSKAPVSPAAQGAMAGAWKCPCGAMARLKAICCCKDFGGVGGFQPGVLAQRLSKLTGGKNPNIFPLGT